MYLLIFFLFTTPIKRLFNRFIALFSIYRTDDIICGLNLGNVALIGNKDPGDVKEQPYTTERMNRIKNGYKALSEPLKIWEFDFNNPEVNH